MANVAENECPVAVEVGRHNRNKCPFSSWCKIKYADNCVVKRK